MKKYILPALLLVLTAACGKDDPENKTGGKTEWPDSPSTENKTYNKGDKLVDVSELDLVWSDEFNTGTMVNTADWTYEKGHVRNQEIQYYTEARPENCKIANGELIITGRQETQPYPAEAGGEEITSASIITNNKHSWKYGRFEIRAKVPAGKGPWPAFWAKGDNQNTGEGWPRCGEIDIMEYASKTPNEMVHNVIYGNSSTDYKSVAANVPPADGKPFHSDYHIYSLDWNERQIVFAVDNKVTHVVNLSGLTPNPFNQPFSLLLNLALGADTERTMGGKLDKSCLPVEFRVDYVRIYKTK
ncbi:MAG: glycoside hydrolase family 16 protein [Prevotella sp.]|jgi:beta-glucanase (GH16 family)|nr:glycoside hydrolase family 16 protein [Prevotella sp.]